MGNAANEITEYILDNQQKLYRVAYYYAKDKDRALDIVQDTVCKVFEKQHTLRNKGAIKTWVYRILINECMNSLRKLKKEYPMGYDELPEEVYMERAYEKEEGIFKYVEALPEGIREVVSLRYYEDLSLKEIAEITDTNLSTVKTRLYTGLKKLKKMLKEGDYEK